jgi:hypothetical protein
VQLEEKKFQQERTMEYLGELLAGIHNNGYPYDGKKPLQRKDFIRLSYDEPDETPDFETIQEQMRLANQALSKHMNPDGN